MNKKGFTLIELLAVVALLAIIMLIAIPSIIGVIEKGRKQTLISDTKKFVTLVESSAIKNDELPSTEGSSKTFYMRNYHFNIDDPDDGDYDGSKSYVKITLSSGKYIYKVKMCGSKRHINETAVSSLALSNVVDGSC